MAPSPGQDPCLDPAELGAVASGIAGPMPRIEAHLASCARCRRRLERERRTQNLIADVRSLIAQQPEGAEAGRGESDHAAGGLGVQDRASGDAVAVVGSLRGYRLLEEISHGGQATVHRAIQDTTGRAVAIKVVRSPSTRELARMEREATLASRLRHPGIVAILDCGRLPGVGFGIAMELVDGVTLDGWVRRLDLETLDGVAARRRIVELAARLCDAVDHAHRRGVIHRDLKPANILVGGEDDPHVLDFGVARAIGRGGETSAGDVRTPPTITRTGEFAGTLAYSAPEQLTAAGTSIDTRSDVYSIGVILHELVWGRMPYDVDGPIDRVVHAIRTAPPAVPRLDRRGLRVDADLATVVGHALAKDPERRYGSVAALGDDLRSVLGGAPIAARRDSTLYILRKAAGTHRGAVLSVLAMLLLVVASTIALSVAYRRTSAALLQADADSARLGETLRATRLREAMLLASGESIAQAEILLWREVLAPSSAAAIGAGPKEPGFVEALWALRQLHERNPCLASWVVGEAPIVAGTTSGEVAWLLDTDGTVHRIDLETREAKAVRLEKPARWFEGGPLRVCFDAAAGECCVAQGDEDRIVRFDLETGVAIGSIDRPSDREVTALAMAPDGTLLLGAGEEVTVRLRDGRTRRVPLAVQPAPSSPLAASGGLLGYYDRDATLIQADLESGEVVRSFRWERWTPGASLPLLLLADGTALVNIDGVVAIDGPTGAGRPVQACHDSLRAIAATPGGHRVASLSIAGLIRVSDAATPESVTIVSGHPGHRTNRSGPLCFDARGDRLVSGSGDGTVRLWRCGEGSWLRRVQTHGRTVHTLAMPQDGKVLLSFDVDGGVCHTSAGVSTPAGRLEAAGHVVFAAVGPDGRTIVHADIGREAAIVSRDSEARGQSRSRRVCPVQAGPFAFSPDGRWLAAGAGFDASPVHEVPAMLWLAEVQGDVERTLAAPAPATGTRAVAFSPDGRTLAWALRDGRIFLVDVGTWTMSEPFACAGPVRSVSFSPDGARLVSAHDSGSLVLWDVQARRALREEAAHSHCVMAARFSPDGTIIASATYGGQVGIWCAHRLRPLAMLAEGGSPIHCMEFDRNGGALHLGSDDGAIMTIDVTAHDQAIAANVDYWIAVLERLGTSTTNAAAMRAWAGAVRAARR